jgi:hypothetical protein
MSGSLGSEIVLPNARLRHRVLYESYGIATDLDPPIRSAKCGNLFFPNQVIQHGPVYIAYLTSDKYYRNFHVSMLRGAAALTLHSPPEY